MVIITIVPGSYQYSKNDKMTEGGQDEEEKVVDGLGGENFNLDGVYNRSFADDDRFTKF